MLKRPTRTTGLGCRRWQHSQSQKQPTAERATSVHKREVDRRKYASPLIQRQIFAQVANRLNIEKLDQWYTASASAIGQAGGAGIIRHYYGSSHVKALMAIFPEHNWLEWRFSKVPDGFWDSMENQKRYLEWLAPQLGVLKLEDWYLVTKKNFVEKAGHSLLRQKYSGSFVNAIIANYQNHNWEAWKFTSAARNRWSSIEMQRQFFDSLRPQLNIASMEDWYNVTGIAVTKLGGEFIRDRYGLSMERALRSIYPEYQWESWRFQKTGGSELPDQ